MATITASAIISVVVYALLGTFINMLIKGSANIAANILSFVLDKLEGNTLNSIVSLVKFPIDIGPVIRVIAFGMIGIILVSGIIKSLTANITGAKTESPWQIGFNCFVAVLLILLFFGTGKEQLLEGTKDAANNTYVYSVISDGFLSQISKVFHLILNEIIPVVKTADSTAASGIASINLQIPPTDYIGLLILSAGLFGSIIGGAISILERFVQLAVFYIIGPVALALYAGSDTRSSAKQWIFGFVTQYAAICISLIMWAAAMQSLDGFLDIEMQNASITSKLGVGAMTIVLFSIAGNSEELLNVIGFKTMSPMDAARTVQNGVSDALRAKSMVSGAAKPFMKPTEDFAKGLLGTKGESGAMENGRKLRGMLGLDKNDNRENIDRTLKGVDTLKGTAGKDDVKNPALNCSKEKANEAFEAIKNVDKNGSSQKVEHGAKETASAVIKASSNSPTSTKANQTASAAKSMFSNGTDAHAVKFNYLDDDGTLKPGYGTIALANRPITTADYNSSREKLDEKGNLILGENGKPETEECYRDQYGNTGVVGDELMATTPVLVTSFDENGRMIDAAKVTGIYDKDGKEIPTANTINTQNVTMPGGENTKHILQNGVGRIENAAVVDSFFGSQNPKALDAPASNTSGTSRYEVPTRGVSVKQSKKG